MTVRRSGTLLRRFDGTDLVNDFCDRLQLIRAVANEHVRWFTETDISVADDDELLALMHDAGCVEILIGLKSALPSVLDGTELKRNWKRTRLISSSESAIARI